MLTNLQRKIICEVTDRYKMPQSELAKWAKKEFNLENTPRQSTISYLLKKRKSYEGMQVSELSSKMPRRLKHPELDRTIANWVEDCQARNINISYDLIIIKSKEFAQILNVVDPPKFSNGWLHKFLKRHGFKKHNVFGESGAVNMHLLKAAIPSLQIAIAQFSPEDVLNKF